MFKVTTRVEGHREQMVDWYEGATEAEALKHWDEDCHRYGIPMGKVTKTVIEVDPKTMNPIGGAQ
jgi:peptidyl-tRNA hydrolase